MPLRSVIPPSHLRGVQRKCKLPFTLHGGGRGEATCSMQIRWTAETDRDPECGIFAWGILKHTSYWACRALSDSVHTHKYPQVLIALLLATTKEPPVEDSCPAEFAKSYPLGYIGDLNSSEEKCEGIDFKFLLTRRHAMHPCADFPTFSTLFILFLFLVALSNWPVSSNLAFVVAKSAGRSCLTNLTRLLQSWRFTISTHVLFSDNFLCDHFDHCSCGLILSNLSDFQLSVPADTRSSPKGQLKGLMKESKDRKPGGETATSSVRTVSTAAKKQLWDTLDSSKIKFLL